MTAVNVADFMQSPLVAWFKSFSEEENKLLEYHHLLDGIFLHDVMLQIDPRPPHRGVCRVVDDINMRIRNLDILVRNVRAFYEEALGQLVVMKLPDTLNLTKDPEAEPSIEDVKGLLLLILGCAVQCDKKEQFIEQIKQLDLTVQHAIVECIQQVTDNPDTVWTQDWSELSLIADEQQEPTFRVLVQHVRRIVKERDDLWHMVNALAVERDGGEKCTTPRGGPPGNISDKHHLGVELADSKAKLRRARQELEEKNESLSEMKEDLEQSKSLVNKLRQETLDLLQDARAAKAYRDELDILRERASKVDKLENEIQRYKDKLNELEFYKSRVEELREDNRILVETKEMLEEQLESSRKRAEQILELENELLRYKARVNELTLERDADRDRMQEIIEENTQLQLSAKHSMNESANLLAELDQLRSHSSSGLNDSLSQQLNNDAQLRLRKMELENQRLLNIIDNLKDSSFHENSDKILELEKENKRLSIKVAQLQDFGSRETQKCLEAEQRHQELLREANKLQEMLETIKTNNERQQTELQREKEQLLELVETLRQRNQKSHDGRLKDIEAENKKLVESTQTMKGHISRLEFDKQQLQKTTERLKESADRLCEVENQKLQVDLENADLHQAIAAFKMTCDRYEKLEQDHAELQMEFKRFNKVLDNMRTTCSKVDKLEQENINLTIENQKLSKALESFKMFSQKLLDLEQEKEELSQANQLLRRNNEALKISRSKFEQMELDVIALNNENQKLQKTLESTLKKLEDIENENQSLENENQKLEKTIETLKVSNRRLNELERENTDLEAENHKLDREKKSLEKEVARLKQAIEVKDTTIDECSSKISTLERESKRLKKDLESTSHITGRVKELEKENREIIQQSMMDKRTLVALREDLVNEKIKTQQLSNELEKLTSELQKIGLKKEKLMVAEQTQDENRYKALETMMEEALKKSLEIKDEKICALESRLEESASRNTELKTDLNKLRQQHEALQQRREEELRSCNINSEKINGSDSKSNLTKEIRELKDHLVEVERTNATMLEENRVLRMAVGNAREQVSGLQQQVANLHHQAAALTEQNGSLQSQNAKLQVENTTLQSQNTSLSTQSNTLSTQNASLESDRDQLLHHQEELQAAHESLVTDHEALQQLHEQLASEYEGLLNELGSQKTSQKSLKIEFKHLKEKYQAVVTAQEEVDRLQEVLEKERELLKADSKSLNNLRAEHSRLKEDFRLLHTTNEKLKLEYKSLQSEYKSLKTEHNTFKLKNTELQGELADTRDQTNALDVDISKLHSKCEMLQHVNATLEEDRRSLMSQVTTLLAQYHELLTQTLDDKDHFHEEEKSFADKLNNLRRQKEKLEEKIMEQYRRMENYSPKKKGFGANLVRKVRRAGTELMNRVPRTTRNKDRDKDRSRRQDSIDTTDGLDNVSLGSGSVSNDSPDSGSDATIRKTIKDDMQSTDSLSDLMDQPSQSRVHRNLAFSTNALHLRKSMSPSATIFDDHDKVFRGSFSSEDIVSLRTESHSSDGHQGDVDSITSSTVSGHSKSQGLPPAKKDELATKRLSLGTPGSRRAVYYTDDHDAIPTRDVGPEVDQPVNRKANDSPSLKYNPNSNSASALDAKSPGTPRSLRRVDVTEPKLPHPTVPPPSTNFATPYSPFIAAASTTPGSSPQPTTNRTSSLRSSFLSCTRAASPPYDLQPSTNHVVADLSAPAGHPEGPATTDTTASEHTTTTTSNNHSPPCRVSPSASVESSSSLAAAGDQLRNRQSWIQPDSSQQPGDATTRNNNVSPSRRPTMLPVTPKLPNSPSKSLPEKSNLNNAAADSASNPSTKPPDNSIWYEYGCV